MTHTVVPKCCGSLVMDGGVLVRPRTGTSVEAPSTVFLVEATETILVDTSFGDPALMAERHPDFEVHRDAGQTVRGVLDDEGYVPGDVDTVVLTHLDWDHCYNLDLFDDDTTVCVQRDELAYAIAPYRMHAVRYEAKSLGRTPPWLDVDLTPLEGETELCAGVTAFPTPGHTVGHQSLAVETDAGTTVVAADAVPTFDNVPTDWSGDTDATADSPFRRGLAMDEFDWWESAHEVVDRADRLLPGHEWAILDADPAGLV
jgi:glyoxylase-like metal-dependent hydrolase (beta-lactamase superfamily II)